MRGRRREREATAQIEPESGFRVRFAVERGLGHADPEPAAEPYVLGRPVLEDRAKNA
jgi:hypothetical protein